jgi:hypothetical protein
VICIRDRYHRTVGGGTVVDHGEGATPGNFDVHHAIRLT